MENKHSSALKISLLSISLVLTSAYTISGSLPLMKANFPEQSLASIEFLATIPAFSVIFMVLMSGFIAQSIGNKKTISIGLIIVGLAGIFPFFSNSYIMILISRLCLGLGLGLINSLAVSMISFFFDGKEKASLMGFRSACEGLGQSVMTFIAGLLLVINWKSAFLVYLIAFPILILFNLFVPEPKQKKIDNKKSKQTINLAILRLAGLLFVLVLIYIAITIRLSSIVVDKGYATATQASTILSIMTISQMLAGAAFGKVYQKLKRFIMPFGIIALALGTLILGLSNQLLITGVGAIFAGIAYPLIASYLFSNMSSLAPKNSETLATSVLLVGCNIGALLAPFGLQLFSKMLNDSIGTSCFIAFSVILFILGLGSFFQTKSLN